MNAINKLKNKKKEKKCILKETQRHVNNKV